MHRHKSKIEKILLYTIGVPISLFSLCIIYIGIKQYLLEKEQERYAPEYVIGSRSSYEKMIEDMDKARLEERRKQDSLELIKFNEKLKSLRQ